MTGQAADSYEFFIYKEEEAHFLTLPLYCPQMAMVWKATGQTFERMIVP